MDFMPYVLLCLSIFCAIEMHRRNAGGESNQLSNIIKIKIKYGVLRNLDKNIVGFQGKIRTAEHPKLLESLASSIYSFISDFR